MATLARSGSHPGALPMLPPLMYDNLKLTRAWWCISNLAQRPERNLTICKLERQHWQDPDHILCAAKSASPPAWTDPNATQELEQPNATQSLSQASQESGTWAKEASKILFLFGRCLILLEYINTVVQGHNHWSMIILYWHFKVYFWWPGNTFWL